MYGEIGLLNCEPAKIELTGSGVQCKVEKELKHMLSMGIIVLYTHFVDIPVNRYNFNEIIFAAETEIRI